MEDGDAVVAALVKFAGQRDGGLLEWHAEGRSSSSRAAWNARAGEEFFARIHCCVSRKFFLLAACRTIYTFIYSPSVAVYIDGYPS